MNLTQKQLTAAFNRCKESPLGKHSFVIYMAHAFLLFAALSRVSRAQNNLGIRGFPGPINALKVAFQRGDGSWKEWTQQMLAKNDIGYAIKLRQRIVG